MRIWFSFHLKNTFLCHNNRMKSHNNRMKQKIFNLKQNSLNYQLSNNRILTISKHNKYQNKRVNNPKNPHNHNNHNSIPNLHNNRHKSAYQILKKNKMSYLTICLQNNNCHRIIRIKNIK